MTTMKERMARAAQRNKARRERLEAQARERGVADVDGYVRAVIEAEDGPFFDEPDGPSDPFLPAGQSLH